MTMRKLGLLFFVALLLVAAVTVFAHPGGPPEPDEDLDGVSDDLDACPLVGGANYNFGCPVEVQPTAAPFVPTAIPATQQSSVTARNLQPADRDQIIALADTPSSVETPIQLTRAVDAAPLLILQELQGLGLVGTGARSQVQQNYMFLNGRGDLFVGLGTSSPSTNLVMNAQLTFNSADVSQFELCSLQARVGRDGQRNSMSFIDVAWVNNGSVAVIDRPLPTGDAATIAVADLGLTLGSTHTLLAVINEDVLTLFVDGALVLENVPVTVREGVYGMSMVGRASSSPRCDARNVWIYGF